MGQDIDINKILFDFDIQPNSDCESLSSGGSIGFFLFESCGKSRNWKVLGVYSDMSLAADACYDYCEWAYPTFDLEWEGAFGCWYCEEADTYIGVRRISIDANKWCRE